MLRLSLRNTLAHKVRFLLTTLAVVMGVGFVVGSFVVTDSMRGSVGQLFEDVTKGVDVSVRATTSSSASITSGPEARGYVPESLVSVVRAVPGVVAAEGAAGGYAQLLDRDGKPLTSTGAPFLGVSWGHVPELVPATIDVGRAPKGRGEVAIDRGSAKDYGFHIGDTTTVLLADGSNPTVRIVGIFTFGEANNLLGARLTAFDVDVAPSVFGTPGQFASIDVVGDNKIAPAVLASRIQDALPDGVEAVTGTTVATENESAVSGIMSVFQNSLLGFAAVALFVAAFFINNTFSIVVGQRTRELALLRSIAATPAQVTSSVVAEAAIVGLLASVLGVGFGLVIATVLRAVLSNAGFGLPDQGTVLAARTIAIAFIVGVGVTVTASLTPARRASSIPPVEGMREGFVPIPRSRARRMTIGLVLTVTGALFVCAGLYVAEGSLQVIGFLGGGAASLFVGVAQLAPVVAVPIASVLGRSVAPVFRTAGRLAHNNAVRNPERTSKTASAVMIGLALVTTVFIVGTSMKRTFTRSIEKSVAADFVFSTAGQTGFSPALTSKLAQLPSIGAITGVRTNTFAFESKTRRLIAVDPATAASVVDVGMRAGDFTKLDDHSILVHKDPARDLQLTVGDEVNVEFASSGPLVLKVAGIYDDSTYAGNYVIGLDLFERYFVTNDLDLVAFARLAPGVSTAAALAEMKPILADFPQVKAEDRSAFQASQEKEFDSLMIAVNGLLGLALFIALLGIANTLALSVLERTREIGLLRAVGMSRGQAREMILAESAMVAVFGAVLGVGLGTLFGVVTASAMPDSIITSVAVPYRTIGFVVIAAAVCGVVAGLLPARRAARLDVLQAIGTTA